MMGNRVSTLTRPPVASATCRLRGLIARGVHTWPVATVASELWRAAAGHRRRAGPGRRPHDPRPPGPLGLRGAARPRPPPPPALVGWAVAATPAGPHGALAVG